jgi:murein DD-endopeptidase MepM/ murein hydrolase activator NlpD/uncharacterized protein YkwD
MSFSRIFPASAIALCMLPVLTTACPIGSPLESYSSFPNSAQLPQPGPGQSKFLTQITEVDISRKLIRANTDTLISPDGTELFYGTPAAHTFSIDAITPVYYINNQNRWISIRELKPGTPIAIYGKPNGNSIIAEQVIIPTPDPKTLPQTPVIPAGLNPIEHDKVCMDRVVVPMIFPIAGRNNWSDTFLASRGGGTRRHLGQDLMASKLTPAVATFSGTVFLFTGRGNAGNIITIEGDNGWTAQYYHMNNDSPGTDDGKGTADFCFAPGIRNGERVFPGQLIGWIGDSGNAEGTAPHIHFEIWSQATGAVYNAAPSLTAAKKLSAPVVFAPAPDLTIPKGYGRYEGVIKNIDRDRQVLILDVIASDTNGKGLQSVTRPTREYLVADAKSKFSIFGLTEPLSFQNILVGDRITTIARLTPPGKGQELTELFALRNLARPVVQTTSQPESQTQPENNGTILLGPNDDFLASLAKVVLDEVNPLRAEKNLAPLTYNPILARTAQTWTVSMVDGDFFDLIDGRINQSLTELAQRNGAPESTIGVISSAPSIKTIANLLLKDYRDDLLSPSTKSLGIGHTYLDEDTGKVTHQHYWAILIARN